MPQAEQRLRDKFLSPPDDGIERCCKIITEAGGWLDGGIIHIEHLRPSVDHPELSDAVEYLEQEWDYCRQTTPAIAMSTVNMTDLAIQQAVCMHAIKTGTMCIARVDPDTNTLTIFEATPRPQPVADPPAKRRSLWGWFLWLIGAEYRHGTDASTSNDTLGSDPSQT